MKEYKIEIINLHSILFYSNACEEVLDMEYKLQQLNSVKSCF